MKFKMSNQPESAFQYSSLTDVVFLLMIFFLLTSQFVIQSGVKVKLPGSKINEPSIPSMLVVTLTAGGVVYAGNEEISIDQLPAKLNVMKGTGAEDNLIIRADRTVAVELVIKVIDAARSSGIDKFTLETEREQL
jgi:biopolymer transport protein ExbD